MFIKTDCPFCSKPAYHSVAVHYLETITFPDEESAHRYVLEYIEVKETVSEEDIARDVLRSVHGYVRTASK